MAEEGAFATVALDKADAHSGPLDRRDAEHQPGKAGSRTEIEPSTCVGREGYELQRVGHVPHPDLLQRRGPNEVLHPLPAP